jgi:hypothetical protein
LIAEDPQQIASRYVAAAALVPRPIGHATPVPPRPQ